tara:strand:- start:2303 stop:2524 length:222 start_codon:yes stop_codon:yes gene_type:complete
MNLIESAESDIKSRMDRAGFEINTCVQNQSKDGCHDTFLAAMTKYGEAASQLEVLRKIKEQLDSQEPEVKDES